MATIVPDIGDQRSQCTGGRTHNGETWTDFFYGTVDTDGVVWGVVYEINNFRGPGAYQNSPVTIEVHSLDATKLCQTTTTDNVTAPLDPTHAPRTHSPP